jgi:hypothetical protein
VIHIFRAVALFLLPSIGVLALVFVVPGTAT